MHNHIEQGLQLLADRKFYAYNDTETWGGFFPLFQSNPVEHNNKILKLIWADNVFRNKPHYNIRAEQVIDLARMCPDFCPIDQTPLDYGRGFNRIINPNNPGCAHHIYFQPSIDHIVPVSLGGLNDISNYTIVSFHANRLKNDSFLTIEELDKWYENMKKTYFP